MKIGIDASRAFAGGKTGTEEYSHQLLRYLTETDTTGSEIFLYVKQGTLVDFALPSNFSLREIQGDFLWTQWHLARELRRNPVDALFVPAHSVPFLHPRKSVVTVHGLEFKNCPDCYARKERIILEINTQLSILFAAKIIVPSENTKRDLMKFYKVPPEKISVIYHGASIMPVAGERKNRDGFNILFIGRLERRKNVARMIRAFDAFMRKMEETPEARGKNAKLILAGKRGFGYEEIQETIARSEYRENIIEKGYVSEKEKKELYANADIFLFPTLAEGFGLPVLEAMSYGVPVITSRSSALAEIAGEGALLVEPADEMEIVSALEKLFKNKEEREDLVRRGYDNLQRFGWEKCAKETWKVLTE